MESLLLVDFAHSEDFLTVFDGAHNVPLVEKLGGEFHSHLHVEHLQPMRGFML